MQNRIIDFGLFLLLAIIWSSSFLLIKIGVASIPPFTLTAARLCIAAAALWTCLAFCRERLILNVRILTVYLVVALLGYCLPYTLIGWGEIRVSSSLAAILMGIMPIVVVLLAHWMIPDEPLNRTKVLGVVISFCGLLMIGFTAFSLFGEDIWGQLGILGGAISYALCTIYIRHQKPVSILALSTGTCTVGAVLSLLFAFQFEDPLHLEPDIASIWATVALGLFPTALAILLFFWLIRRLGASTFSQINYLIPVLGGLWGIWLLNEPFSWRLSGALLLVLSGIYLVQKPSVSGRNTSRLYGLGGIVPDTREGADDPSAAGSCKQHQ